MIRSAVLSLSLFLLIHTPLPAQQPPSAEIYRVPVTGVIEMGIAPFIERSIEEAEAAGAAAVVLDIDTPGGRIDAAQQIVDAVSDADLPVYAYVNRRALSAGALIALATDGIYMRPGATLGAATPVTGDGEQASEKVVSAFRTEFRALAEERGLDPRIAEAMVDADVAVEGVVPAGKLLTLSTDQAVALGYAGEVQDWSDLTSELQVSDASVVQMDENWAEGVVRFLTNPLVAPFLLSLGFLGLLIEIKTPTFGLAGLAGATSLGLFFGSHLIVGLAGWEVVILLLVGIVLLLVEALVLPGFGIAGGLGILALSASIFLSLIGNFPTTGDILIAINILGVSLLIVGFATWQLIRHLPHDRRAQMILHRSRMTRDRGYSSSTRRDDLVGAEGITLTDLRPAGTAQFGDEKVDVVSDGGWIEAGTPVWIVRSEGYRHVVAEVAKDKVTR